jgi:hypothetical protein
MSTAEAFAATSSSLEARNIRPKRDSWKTKAQAMANTAKAKNIHGLDTVGMPMSELVAAVTDSQFE